MNKKTKFMRILVMCLLLISFTLIHPMYINASDKVSIKGEETYNINYFLDDGENDLENPFEYKSSDETIVLKNATKEGYIFRGWYTEDTFENKVTEIVSGTTGDIDLYAKWQPCKYIIKFNGNGATSGSMTNMSGLLYDEAYTLTANGFTKKGYEFAGWKTKNGTTVYKNKETVKNLTTTNGETVTLYAQWKLKEYKITYVLNGGTNNKNNKSSYTILSSTLTLKEPTKKGYTFVGWYTDSKLTKTVAQIASGSTGDKTFYAKWEANKYTIKFNANGGKGSMKNMSNLSYGTSYKLKANAFTKKGYEFVGWKTKNGTTIYKDKESVKGLLATDKGTITLYAQWKAKKYNIKYVLKGGTNNPNNKKSYYITTSTFTLKTPTRDCYSFEGWYSDSKLTKKVTKVAKGSTGDKTFYAKWKKQLCYIGYGDDVISNVKIPKGNYKVKLSYVGRSNFIVKFYESPSSKYWDLLANEIGSYEGENVIRDGKTDKITNGMLEITAKGNWKLEFVPITGTASNTIKGKGDMVTGWFNGTGTRKKISFTHDGSSNFIVWMYSSKGGFRRDLLVNEIGYYDASCTYLASKGEKYYFHIQADGNWTIKR